MTLDSRLTRYQTSRALAKWEISKKARELIVRKGCKRGSSSRVRATAIRISRHLTSSRSTSSFAARVIIIPRPLTRFNQLVVWLLWRFKASHKYPRFLKDLRILKIQTGNLDLEKTESTMSPTLSMVLSFICSGKVRVSHLRANSERSRRLSSTRGWLKCRGTSKLTCINLRRSNCLKVATTAASKEARWKWAKLKKGTSTSQTWSAQTSSRRVSSRVLWIQILRKCILMLWVITLKVWYLRLQIRFNQNKTKQKMKKDKIPN